MRQIASFDVFDTILTRIVDPPESAFLLLGRSLEHQGLISHPPEVFARARIAAEERAHQSHGASCTIGMIYTEMGKLLGLAENDCTRLIQYEYLLEKEIIRPIPGAANRINRAREEGKDIVFLSDIYLSSEYICQILFQNGLWKEGDHCYISCERGKTKQSGALFLDMIANEKIAPQAVVYQGNHPEADARPALRAGLRFQSFYQGNANRYETILGSYGWQTGALSSAMAGASRLARLSGSATSRRENALREVAAGVMAPALVGYVLWVLFRAQELNLKRLYFLSRDGQVLLEIAQRLKKKLNLQCDLRYLYGSRQSWNLPAIMNGSDDEFEWIWDRSDHLSVRSLLARVNLEPEQVSEPLALTDLTSQDWDRPLDKQELEKLKKSLLTLAVRRLVVERVGQKRSTLLKYLEQEGVLENTSWGLVDLGWYGSLQNSLSAVLEETGGTLPVGFYFALLKGDIIPKYAENREAYYFDEHQGQGDNKLFPDLITLMEMFCVSDHGTVVDFAEESGQVKPILKEKKNQRPIDWGLPLARETLDWFLDTLLLDENLISPQADIRGALADLLSAFWLDPSAAEVAAWADFPWEDGLGIDTSWTPLAESFTFQDLFRALYRGRIEPHQRASWMNGSLRLSPYPVRQGLICLARYFHFYRPLRWRVQARLRTWLSN